MAAMKTASEYLRNPIFRSGADLKDLKDLLSAWAWLYPDEPDLQIVLANLDLKTGDFFNAFCRLNRVCEMEELSSITRKIVQRGFQQWINDAQRNYSQIGMTPHVFKILWEPPVHFMRDGIDPANIPNFVALTEMKSPEISDSKSSLVKPSERPGVILRADRVGDFVAESWGDLGKAILGSITTLLESVINTSSTSQTTLKQVNGWPFSECTFIASRSTLAISAICPGSMWHSLTKCVLWIIDVVGQPGEKGAYKRGAFYDFGDVYGREELEKNSPGAGAFHSDKVLEDAEQEVTRMRALALRQVSDLQLPPTIRGFLVREYRDDDPAPEETSPYDLCWKLLFDRAFIIPYTLPFTIYSSLDNCGKGLRVSFDTMISIAGIERAVIWEGGLILTGLTTALVPMQLLCARPRSIQWHFIELDERDDQFRSIHNREEFWNEVNRLDRLLERDLDRLKGIGYIGWVPQVKICHTPGKVDYSSMAQVDHKWLVKERGLQIGFQIPLPGGLAPGVQAIQNWERSSAALRFPPSVTFSRRIELLFQSRVFIYDTGVQIAWLCAPIDLILLMLRYYLADNEYPDFWPSELHSRIASQQEDKRWMKQLMALKLDYLHVPNHPAGDQTYGALMTEFSLRFETAFGSLSNSLRSKSRDKLLGFEFIDLVISEGMNLPRELPVKGKIDAWSSFVGISDVVFCTGLDEIIKPYGIGSAQLCRFIQRPPERSNILVCPVYLLKRYLHQQGCEFHPHHISKQSSFLWIFKGNPFKCPHNGCNTSQCWKNRVQEVLAIDTSGIKAGYHWLRRGSQGSSCSISLESDGALCFGKL